MIPHQTSIKPQPNKRLEASSQLEDILLEALCLAELISKTPTDEDFQLSFDAAMGLAAFLRGFNDRGWKVLDTLMRLEDKKEAGNE